jgi:hypothetical protein
MIISPSAPPRGWKEYLEGHEELQQLVRKELSKEDSCRPVDASSEEAFASRLEVAEPIPVFMLSNREFAEQRTADIKPSSWLCLILNSDNVVGAFELVAREGNKPRISGTMRSAALGVLAKVLEVLPRELRAEDELRILEMPGISFRALWIVGHDGSPGAFIPFAENMGLKREVYNEGKILEILRSAVGEEIDREKVQHLDKVDRKDTGEEEALRGKGA